MFVPITPPADQHNLRPESPEDHRCNEEAPEDYRRDDEELPVASL